MDDRPPQNLSSSSSSSSCCDCCQCNSQACSAYLIGILASILIISGVFLAFHRWDYAWLIISLIGTILMFIGSVLYFCVSNNDQQRRRSSAAKQSSSNAHHISPTAPTLDQSRSVSQLSLNMLPPYFPAFDTISMTSHLPSSTTPSVHATVSQILNINGQAFLMLPLATAEVSSQDTHSLGTKTLNSDTTQISINPSGPAGPKTPAESRRLNQPGNRESICAVTPLFVTLPPVKKEPPLSNLSPDVLLLTDAMLGRGTPDNQDKANDSANTQSSQSHQASIGIQVETLPLSNKESTNEVPSPESAIPVTQEVSLTINDAVLMDEGQSVRQSLPLCQDAPSNMAIDDQNINSASSQSSLQLSNNSIVEGTVVSEVGITASESLTDNAIVTIPTDPSSAISDSGISDPNTQNDAREATTDLDDMSEITDDFSMTTPLVPESALTSGNEHPEASVGSDSSPHYDVLPCNDPSRTVTSLNIESETRGTCSADVEAALVFPSTSVEATDCEPLLPNAGSHHSLCDTDDETYLEGSSSPPPSYEEVARDSNHSTSDYAAAYGTI